MGRALAKRRCAIAGNESFDTRIGHLTFAAGYPSAETVQKLYDELDFQRAVQLYLWALPAVSVQVALDGIDETYGSSPTTVAIFEHFLDAATVVATGNGQSIYAMGKLDLSSTGPVVIEAPAGVLGFIMDLWQYPLEDVGGAGPDKGQGGKFLILPPGDARTPPDGYFVVPSDTYGVNWLLRGYAEAGNPEPAVQLLKQMRVNPLAAMDDPPPMNFVNASGVPAVLLPIGDELTGPRYFETLARIVEHEPARDKDRAMLGLAASIGIEKGKPFAPDVRLQQILAEAARVGSAMAETLSYESRSPRKYTWPGKRWEEIFQADNATMENDNYLDIDAKTILTYQAMGASKAALLSQVGVGSKYSAAFKDCEGRWLDGAYSYRLHVPPDVPAKDFWSVTVYDVATRSMIANEQGKGGCDSYAALAVNDDDSIDLTFRPTPPDDAPQNWVQTIPGQGFFLYFRWYGPLQPYFDQSWQLPDVERMSE